MDEHARMPTFREMARAIGNEDTPPDGDPECGCIYCATGMGGWCSSRPMPLGPIPRLKAGDRISFPNYAPLLAHDPDAERPTEDPPSE